ncbi:MAG: cytochrome c biogenesis protein CcdA [Pseudomonadota bacterium]
MAAEATLVTAFGAGILSFVSPCVLPLVPPYLGFLAGVSLDELTGTDDQAAARSRVFNAALAFVLGFSTVFIALGAASTFVGQLLQSQLALLGPIAGAIVIVMGLHFLGVFRINLLFREARFHIDKKPAGLIGAYLVGLAFAIGWTPCIGPILGVIMGIAATESTVYQGVILLAFYAAGLGVPFLLAALFAGPFLRFMKDFRRHMASVERVMGAFLVTTGVLFITGHMSTFSFWLLDTFPVLASIG